jgi:hypothetical protein
MPLVQVTLRKGKPTAFLHAVGDAIHRALVAEAKIPAEDRFQAFHELDDAKIIADPKFAGATARIERSADLLIIQITLNVGRTDEVKSRIYAEIVAQLREVGVRPDDVFISLIEVVKQNWSMASGVTTYPS